MMIKGQINSLEEIDAAAVTFDDICGWGGTFITNSSGTGRYKTYNSRCGVSTKMGDIEESVWRQLAEKVITREGEEQLFSFLSEWEKEHNYTKASPKELHMETLRLHAARIFDNPLWVYFIPFNKRYRPDVYTKAHVVVVVNECCNKPGEVTQEQLDAAYEGTVACPHCGRRSLFAIQKHKRESDPCLGCDCNDPDVGCTMPSIDRSYACPLKDGGC